MEEQEGVVDMIIQRLDSRVRPESPAHHVYGKRLNSIKKILQEATSNEIDEETDLKEVVFDTDTVLTTIEDREKSKSSSSPLSPRPLISYSPPLEWLFRQKIKRRLSKIQRDLEKIAPSHGSVRQADTENGDDGSVKRLGGGSGRHVFFSESIKRRLCEEKKFLTDSTNKAFKTIMDWLLLEGKSDEIDVFGIVGESGVGKTLLARKIFEDKEVKDHFKFRFWVDIPKNCDDHGAIKSMLRELSRYRTGNIILEYQKPENNLKSLVKVIKGSYLLVLDNSDHFDSGCKWWNHLKSYLPVLQGSKVVAISNDVNADIESKITLEPLEEEESMNLFCEAAMKKVNSDLMKTAWIEKSAKMILSKCCGLPIAINAMGAMLADKNQEQWEVVLEKLKDFEGKAAVKACLLLCCEDLKDDCKKCFQSLSIFGELDMEIDKMSLIYWWIGEGIVRSEDKGKKVFKMLVSRSLVEGIMTGKGKIYSCRVHLIVRNLLLEEMNKDEQSKTKSPRRLRFCTELKVMKLDEKEQKKPIESILQVGNDDPNYLILPVERFPELKQLKVLHLGWWQKSSWFHVEISSQNFISSLCYLENLSYLSLRGISGITKLPRSIKKLQNLQILDLRACYDLEKLPKEITSLKKLTHLDTSRCYFLEFMPKGVGKLSKLVSLRGFKLGNSRNKHCCRLRELQNLKNLSKLSIRIWSEDEVQDDELKLFSNFDRLTALRLEFGYRKITDEASNSNFAKKLNHLCPPSHLIKLELLCYPGEEIPVWLNPSKLSYLQRLYFSGGPLRTLNNLVVSGQKWNLNTLYLRFLANLQGREEELSQAMPDLVLKVHKCPKFDAAMVEQTIHEEEDDPN